MSEQENMNKGLVERILDITRADIAKNPEHMLINPSREHSIADLLEFNYDKGTTTNDVEEFSRFVASHLNYQPRADSPVYEIFGKKIDEINGEEFSKQPRSSMVELLKGISNNLFNYFDVHFDPENLNERDKKRYEELTTRLGVRDPFMSRESGGKRRIEFKQEVKDNPRDYLSIRFEAGEIYNANKEKFDDALAAFLIESHEAGKEWQGGPSDVPGEDTLTGLSPALVHTELPEVSRLKEFWHKNPFSTFGRILRKAKHNRKKLERGKIEYWEESFTVYREADNEVGQERRKYHLENPESLEALTGKEKAYLGVEYKKRRLRDWKIAAGILIGMIPELILGGGWLWERYINKTTNKPLSEYVGETLQNMGPGQPPGEGREPKIITLPPEYTERACEDNCSEYFEQPEQEKIAPAPICTPEKQIEVRYRDREIIKYVEKDCPPCNCEGRKEGGGVPSGAGRKIVP